MKYLIEAITILISVIAICISIRSCNVSQESNEIAKKSLETTELHYRISERPYVDISLLNIEEPYQYVKFWEKDEALHYFVKFQLENTGNTPAKNISFVKATGKLIYPKIRSFDVKFEPDPILFELTSNQPEVIRISGSFENYVNRIPSGDDIDINTFVLIIDLVLSYKSDINSQFEYKSSVIFHIEKNSYTILKKSID